MSISHNYPIEKTQFMTMTTRLFSYFNGKLVGVDEFGNRYFTEKKPSKKALRVKRWVMYNGAAEPSKVPANWHGWLHYTHNNVPTPGGTKHYDWEKSHLPNLTGTVNAYVPEGSARASGKHAKTVASYEAWTPK